jgi:hypothetical protein
LFAFCCREIERLAAGYAGNGKTWMNNYRLGIVDTIGAKLAEATRSVRGEARQLHGSAADRAIVRIDEKAIAVENFVKTNLNLKKAAKVTYRSDVGARARGQMDGQSIQVGDSGPGLSPGTRGEIESKAKPVCECGHTGGEESKHAPIVDYGFGVGNGRCTVDGCSCRKFVRKDESACSPG